MCTGYISYSLEATLKISSVVAVYWNLQVAKKSICKCKIIAGKWTVVQGLVKVRFVLVLVTTVSWYRYLQLVWILLWSTKAMDGWIVNPRISSFSDPVAKRRMSQKFIVPLCPAEMIKKGSKCAQLSIEGLLHSQACRSARQTNWPVHVRRDVFFLLSEFEAPVPFSRLLL